ncbi:TniQ family protein [Herbaspirillum huttiense]|uniref:TniQ family protein n=1 Tax=Herbaspirillum huttiense TaxID=863372 RepID=UPI002E78C58E|nr:TniQ family protein [Herbaspirillum huttiense]MEE1636923.1 TniQ family protein [Herbaspirillum huttiense NC40101]
MFLFRPPPLPSESLSSWRQRIALDNGFLRFPRAPNEKALDPDRMPTDDIARWLINYASVAPETLKQLTAEEHIGETSPTSGKIPWLITLGNRSTSQVAAPMFCPECLSEDSIPYFRIAWRSAFWTHCQLHGNLLSERCPACLEKIWPWGYQKISDLRWRPLHICRCGNDLRNILNTSGTQPRICSLKQSESFGTNEEARRSLFAISQLLVRRTHIQLRWRVMERWQINLSRANPGIRSISQLTVSERAKYLAAARNILDDWPHTLIGLMTEAKISHRYVLCLLDAMPSAMRDLVNKELAGKRSNLLTTKPLLE